MIKINITNDILNKIIEIEKNKTILENTKVPVNLQNAFRKNTKKKTTYYSNAIEGNLLTYNQASKVIEDRNRHLIKSEQEILNYYLALEYLEKCLVEKKKITLDLILDVQKIIVRGEPKEKEGIRGPMPPGVIFAVYENKTNQPEYIPPEYKDIDSLLNELIDYLNNSNDHPIIKSAILHYQLVTIHPFGDGNGRTSRIMASYLLSYYGYGFKSIGSIEEYFAYDIEEYYRSIQMNLPVLYYEGRDNPPHPEIWINYYLKVMSLYTNKVISVAKEASENKTINIINNLSYKPNKFLKYLKKNNISEYIPIEIAKKLNVTNKTVINWSMELSNNGFVKPNIFKKRIRSYKVLY